MTIAGWPRRILALFIDWFVALLSVAALTGSTIGSQDVNAAWPLAAFFVEVSLVTGLMGYSIGKRVAGIKVIGYNGGRIGFARSVLRTALLCLVLPALVNTDEQRGLHDLAAGSMVVRARG